MIQHLAAKQGPLIPHRNEQFVSGRMFEMAEKIEGGE